MKLWYRCAMCSPNQSKSFDIESADPRLSEAMRLVSEYHKLMAPDCPAARDPHAVVEVLLVRMVQ